MSGIKDPSLPPPPKASKPDSDKIKQILGTDPSAGVPVSRVLADPPGVEIASKGRILIFVGTEHSRKRNIINKINANLVFRCQPTCVFCI